MGIWKPEPKTVKVKKTLGLTIPTGATSVRGESGSRLRETPLGVDGNNYQSGRGDYPVNYVSWYAAMAYAKWKDKRLSTEAEWKKRREAI